MHSLAAAITLAEPEVALSDFAVALIAAVCGFAILRAPAQDAALRRWFAVFFATLAASALVGGLDHGFFREADSRGHAIAWPLTLLLIGSTGGIVAVIASRLSLPPRGQRFALVVIVVLLIGFAARVLLGARDFSVAIAAYLVPALWLLGALLVRGFRVGSTGAFIAAGGIALILAGSAVQHFEIGIGSGWLGHNTLYHVIVAGGLVLLAVGARPLLATRHQTIHQERTPV